MAELLLRRLALQELHVVDQEEIDLAQALLEGDAGLIADRGDEVEHEVLGRQIDDVALRSGHPRGLGDRMKKMRLAAADAGMEEERIVRRVLRAVGDHARRRQSDAVGRAFAEAVEGVAVVDGRAAKRTGDRLRPAHRRSAHGCPGRRLRLLMAVLFLAGIRIDLRPRGAAHGEVDAHDIAASLSSTCREAGRDSDPESRICRNRVGTDIEIVLALPLSNSTLPNQLVKTSSPSTSRRRFLTRSHCSAVGALAEPDLPRPPEEPEELSVDIIGIPFAIGSSPRSWALERRASLSKVVSPSRLRPGESGHAPTRNGVAVSFSVERALKAGPYIETVDVAGGCHGDGRRPAACTGAAQEIERRVLADTASLQLGTKLTCEVRDTRTGREGLPLDEERSLADCIKRGDADIGPFGGGANVDKRRVPSVLNACQASSAVTSPR